VIRKINKFKQLPHEQRILFIEAWLLSGYYRISLKLVSFKRLIRLPEQQQSREDTIHLTDLQKTVSDSVARTVARMAGNTPWQSACLIQALVAQNMLRRRGIPGVIFLGVKKDQNDTDQIDSHAWLKCGETIITGLKGIDEFTVISRFSWE